MPTYEYQCNACGVRFDRFHSINANPHYDCPECGGDVRKLISAPPILFKGSGWYITDSRNGGSSGESKSSSKSETKAEKSESSSSDTKPAAESKPSGESKAEASTASSPTTSK